ncbi:hypothetical protein V6N13_109971 [Hibiscus sabdariffa]
MRVDWDDLPEEPQQPEQDSNLNFDFLSLVSKPKDYYKILEVDYDATEDDIRSNYIRLALKWHPDKQKDDENCATSRFQEINEAYQDLFERLWCLLVNLLYFHAFKQGRTISYSYETCLQKKCLTLALVELLTFVLIDPDKRSEYDKEGMLYAYDYDIIEYLNRYKGLILTLGRDGFVDATKRS